MRLFEFVYLDRTFFNRKTILFGNFNNTFSSYPVQNSIVCRRGNKRSVYFEENIHRACFFKVFMITGISPNNLLKSFFKCFGGGIKLGSIVSCSLCKSNTTIGSTAILFG